MLVLMMSNKCKHDRCLCVCHEQNKLIIHDHACCSECLSCKEKVKCNCKQCFYQRSYIGPFYRKSCTDNVWFEVNKDGQGGLYLIVGNLVTDTNSNKSIHFKSENEFFEFIDKLKADFA